MQTDGGYAGGNWNNTSNAGLGYRNANNERSNTNNNIGFRPAFLFMQEGISLRAAAQSMEKEPTSWQDQTFDGARRQVPKENAAEAPFDRANKKREAMPKTYNNLAHLVYDFENLDAAFHDMSRGMRYKQSVMDYRANYEENIINLQNHLIWQTYRPWPYHEFMIYEPKLRKISAPHIEDRLVQHALCRIVEPLFDRKFIYDSYACRKGKGTLAAAKRVQHFIRCQGDAPVIYYLRIDFRKYFHSIPHETIKKAIRRTISDKWVLWLFDCYIDSYPQGIPIGSLTSQLLANVVLDLLDHHLTDGCGRRFYARYMDDIIIVDKDLEALQKIFDEAIKFSSEELGLEINLSKSHISVCEYTYDDGSKFESGIDFAGYVIKRNNLYPRKRNVKNANKRLRKIAERKRTGYATQDDINASAASFTGQMKHCTWTPNVRKVIVFIQKEIAV